MAGRRGLRRGPRPGDRAPHGHAESAGERVSLFEVCGGVRHHLLLFEGPTPDPRTPGQTDAIERLLGRYAVDISIHDVPAPDTTLHARYGARAPLLFLIRPDGHLAYAGKPEDLDRLGAYLDRIYLRAATTVG